MGQLSALLSIVVINVMLSGDNAVVIAMAAHQLPQRQRKTAIMVGGSLAAIMRIALTLVAAKLLTIAAIKVVGGLMLLWIAFQMLKEEEERSDGVHVAESMAGAVGTILVADFVMSLDNVLGVAAAANGDLTVLIFGLVTSMAIVMLGAGLMTTLLDRLWWVAYIGSGVIAWTALELLVSGWLDIGGGPPPRAVELSLATIGTAATILLAHYFHRRRPARMSTNDKTIENPERVRT